MHSAARVMGYVRKLGLCSFYVLLVGVSQAAPPPVPDAAPIFKQYCASCHGKAATAGINVDQLTGSPLAAKNFAQGQKVAAVLKEKRMPPPKMPQPKDEERTAAVKWVRINLKNYAEKNAGDPGGVT